MVDSRHVISYRRHTFGTRTAFAVFLIVVFHEASIGSAGAGIGPCLGGMIHEWTGNHSWRLGGAGADTNISGFHPEGDRAEADELAKPESFSEQISFNPVFILSTTDKEP